MWVCRCLQVHLGEATGVALLTHLAALAWCRSGTAMADRPRARSLMGAYVASPAAGRAPVVLNPPVIPCGGREVLFVLG